MTSFFRTRVERDPTTVPVYVPICRPDPVNLDPKRHERPCPATKSLSEPLSNEEYLRRRKANNYMPLGGAPNTVRYGSGKYVRTIWTSSGNTCDGRDLVLPAVPAVHPGLHALDSSLVSSERAAFAARGKVSFYDSVNHTEWNTLKRREGVVVAADRTFMAPVGGLREKCKTCEVSGSTITPGNPGCNC